jgi:hypothetical protein
MSISDQAAYERLGKLVLDASVSPADWERFMENAEVLRISKGTRIIEAGEHADMPPWCK